MVTLLLASCATTEGDVMGGRDSEDIATAENHSWIVDAPPSAALDPDNWLDYSAYYLGEIVLMPFRLVEMIFDGS